MRGSSRPGQRLRTRRKLLAAAADLIAHGFMPTTTEVADAANISRRTAYRYFPTQQQLLVESSLEGLRPQVEGAMSKVRVLPAGKGMDDVAWAAARLDATVRVMHRLALQNKLLLRTIQRLTAGGAASAGMRPRGSRRIDWLTSAVEPVRHRLGRKSFERLVSALCSCVGFDSLFVLQDVRGLSPREAEAVTRWMAAAMLQASVAQRPMAQARSRSNSPPRKLSTR